MHSPCDRLDDYLCGCLAAGERAAFEQHLAECGVCRDEVLCQQRIDRLLQQATAHDLPQDFTGCIEGRIRIAARRGRLMRVCGLAAAACVLAAFFFWRPEPTLVKPPELTASKPDTATPVAQVVVDPQCELLAVPQKSSQANVTIYWFYPTISTAATAASDAVAEPTSESET